MGDSFHTQFAIPPNTTARTAVIPPSDQLLKTKTFELLVKPSTRKNLNLHRPPYPPGPLAMAALTALRDRPAMTLLSEAGLELTC